MRLKRVSLTRFCGFSNFDVDLGDFTALVGPNNGGKTTVLRAIKFALDAVRLFFEEKQPYLKRFDERNNQMPLAHVAPRLSVVDLSLLYFGKDRQTSSEVSLTFDRAGIDLVIRAVCAPNRDDLQLDVAYRSQSIKHAKNSADAQDILNDLFDASNAEFIPPPGTIGPRENVMAWGDILAAISQGRVNETWRNRFHWLNEGEEPEAFQRTIGRVAAYLPDVRLRPPRRSRREPVVEVNYLEGGAEYDISAGGGGLRTLVTLAANLELSSAKILLFDEPDAHLHSAIQRQTAMLLQDAASAGRQIIITSHAPDFIEEVPVDSLVWIDRKENVGRKCDDVGKALVELGAISNARALETLGTDTLIYFEGADDRSNIKQLMVRCGKHGLASRSRLEVLGGFGAEKSLPGALDVLQKLLRTRVALAAILDADFLKMDAETLILKNDDVFVARLPCKELENLLLLSPVGVVSAAQEEAKRRAEVTYSRPRQPSVRRRKSKNRRTVGGGGHQGTGRPAMEVSMVVSGDWRAAYRPGPARRCRRKI